MHPTLSKDGLPQILLLTFGKWNYERQP
jgi:hypothetical protein